MGPPMLPEDACQLSCSAIYRSKSTFMIRYIHCSQKRSDDNGQGRQTDLLALLMAEELRQELLAFLLQRVV